jgi:hypothetical protein
MNAEPGSPGSGRRGPKPPAGSIAKGGKHTRKPQFGAPASPFPEKHPRRSPTPNRRGR